jgi:hypothetical protein
MENIKEEIKLAEEANDYNEKGVPRIGVMGDGGWGTRSYNHSMRSNVGWVSAYNFFSLS